MHSPMFTLEVFPPKRNAPVGTIYDTLDGLEGLNPDFISVTYGHGTHSDRTATALTFGNLSCIISTPTFFEFSSFL